MHHDRLTRLMAKALANGATMVSNTVCEWDLSGKCQFPRVREIHSRPSAQEGDIVRRYIASVKAIYPGAKVTKGFDRRPTRSKNIRVDAGPLVPAHKRTKVPLTIRLTLRCRKCDRCLRLRSMVWEQRAKAELQAAPRTWFGTLTLRPHAHSAMVNRARARLRKQGIDFDLLPFGEQFLEQHREVGVEVTKYLKRIRKICGSFRYLCVVERHASGLPHYHLLVHEMHEGAVKHAVLSSQWILGFERWVLCTELRQASYLCKYLSKTAVSRVRASARYGQFNNEFQIKEGAGGKPGLPALIRNHVFSSEAREHGVTTPNVVSQAERETNVGLIKGNE